MSSSTSTPLASELGEASIGYGSPRYHRGSSSALPVRAVLWACAVSACILGVWCYGTWRADECSAADAAGTACKHGHVPATPRQSQHKASGPAPAGLSGWMGDNADALAARTLHDITLPGSHDSASFFLDGKVMPGSLPWPLDDIVQMATDAGTLAASYIIRWSQSQTLDIAEQLEAGIRYFDLRAGFNGSHWVACHTLSGAPLFPMVLHLATFLQANPREVVVVELTHVYNARDDVLDVLRNLLSRVLGPWLDRECRLTQTFEERWQRDSRLVMVSNVERRPQDRWCDAHAIKNSYANSDSMEEMWRYNEQLVQAFEPQDGVLLKISWTLTPHLTTMARGLLLPPSTLKDLADIANAELPAFVEAAVRGRNHSGFPQILIADDFSSATLLPVVLQLNGLSHRPPLR